MTQESIFYTDHLRDKLSNYEVIMDSQNIAGLIIPSGIPKQQFLDDNPYPFKVNVHFKALIPVTDVPNSYIIYQPGSKPALIFYQPEDYWHVVPSDPAGPWVDLFDIKIVKNTGDWKQLLPKAREGFAWLGEPEEGLQELGVSTINPSELLNPIHYQRAYKSEYEIACLQQANLKAARGHLAAKAAFLNGASEMEIHLAYLQATGHKEEELPYGNIVALNHHGAVLHYTDLDSKKLPESNRHSFLIDAGAVHHGYCADITRTWACQQGEFNDLIQQFDQLQLKLIDQLSDGNAYIDMHVLAHLEIARFLKDADFIYCDAETALDTGISSTFFPHGLGHMLGLQVHDIGGHQVSAEGEIQAPPSQHPFLRLTKKLEPGFCITIEPGVYFIDMLLNQLAETKHARQVNWAKVDAFKKFGGIRIEDDVVIKSNGVENLSRKAFAKATA